MKFLHKSLFIFSLLPIFFLTDCGSSSLSTGPVSRLGSEEQKFIDSISSKRYSDLDSSEKSYAESIIASFMSNNIDFESLFEKTARNLNLTDRSRCTSDRNNAASVRRMALSNSKFKNDLKNNRNQIVATLINQSDFSPWHFMEGAYLRGAGEETYSGIDCASSSRFSEAAKDLRSQFKKFLSSNSQVMNTNFKLFSMILDDRNLLDQYYGQLQVKKFKDASFFTSYPKIVGAWASRLGGL